MVRNALLFLDLPISCRNPQAAPASEIALCTFIARDSAVPAHPWGRGRISSGSASEQQGCKAEADQMRHQGIKRGEWDHRDW